MSAQPFPSNARERVAPAPQLVNVVLSARGAIAGCFGAASVAVWFLLIDTLVRTPLYSPSVAGSVVLGGVAPQAANSFDLGMVAGFSLVHCLAFAAFGVLASFVLRAARVQPTSIIGIAGLALALQTAFVLAESIAAPGLAESIGWVFIAAANAAAAITMSLCFASLPSVEEVARGE